jgi:hypothetical protein
MKHDISWHQNCYNNWKILSDKEDADLVLKRKRWSKNKDELDFYKKQIETAKLKRKDSFDVEKFLIKKGIQEKDNDKLHFTNNNK